MNLTYSEHDFPFNTEEEENEREEKEEEDYKGSIRLHRKDR